MKDIVILVLSIFLIVTILYLFLLKRNIKKFRLDLEKKLKTNSKTLITTNINDKDITMLIDDINKSIESFFKIKNDYDKKNNNLQKMITNISHDLRTPLTSALGYIDLILNSNVNKEDYIKELKIIEDRLKRLSELIDSFFEFSKIISNNESTKTENINLVAVMEKSISNHYEDFSKNSRLINLKIDAQKIIIKSNEIMLSRVFDNLIRNAYKHSKSDLDIYIKSVDNIEIIFENDLLYYDLDTDRIFDEFYTVDISRTKGNTGLGLAIAKEFTNKLNGTIYARKINHKLCIIINLNNTNIN